MHRKLIAWEVVPPFSQRTVQRIRHPRRRLPKGLFCSMKGCCAAETTTRANAPPSVQSAKKLRTERTNREKRGLESQLAHKRMNAQLIMRCCNGTMQRVYFCINTRPTFTHALKREPTVSEHQDRTRSRRINHDNPCRHVRFPSAQRCGHMSQVCSNHTKPGSMCTMRASSTEEGTVSRHMVTSVSASFDHLDRQ